MPSFAPSTPLLVLVLVLAGHTSAIAQPSTIRVITGAAVDGPTPTNAPPEPKGLSGDGSVALLQSRRLVVLDDDLFIRDVAAGTITRILGHGGAEPNGRSSFAALSRDGRYAIFNSRASNLVANDSDGAIENLFRFDRVTNTLTRYPQPAQTANASGRFAGSGSMLVDLDTGTSTPLSTTFGVYTPRPSADGRYVAFQSLQVPGVYDAAAFTQVFILDRTTGDVALVSRANDGSAANAGTELDFSISDDGRYISFASRATNLVDGDTNGASDIFVHDRVAQTTTRASVQPGGAQREQESWSPALSGNGRVVTFETTEAFPPCPQCYTRRQLVAHDLDTGLVSQVNVASDGTVPPDQPSLSSVSFVDFTGRRVLFSADAYLVPDRSTGGGVFLRDRGPVGCVYVRTPAVVDMPTAGGLAPLSVTSAPGCPWSAGTASDWLTLSVVSGTGDGQTVLTVGANTGISRFGYAWLAGQRVFVRQAGPLAPTPPTFERVEPQLPGGTPRNVIYRAISSSGRYVAYLAETAPATTSVGTVLRAYLRDRVADQTIDISARPGGPPDDPALPHDLAASSEDGRRILFSARPQNPLPGQPVCYLFDRHTGSSTALPWDFGSGLSIACPQMSRNGRFLVGKPAGMAANRVLDLDTGQTRLVPIPGMTFQHRLTGPWEVSDDGRYTISRVIFTPNGCFSAACDQVSWLLFDTVTGAVQQTAGTTSFSEMLLLRQQLLDSRWQEFGLPRFDARPNFAGINEYELLDRQTGARTALPAIARFGSGGWLMAVNEGKQILFSSGANVLPGHPFAHGSLLTYTVATGAIDRLVTTPTGDGLSTGGLLVSSEGRWLLVAVRQSPGVVYPGNDELLLFDLGLGTGVDGPTPANDTDTDGLPDAWEHRFGLNAAVADAHLDPDGDGVTNAAEFASGTHPRGTAVRYFGEGATSDFFSTRMALLNTDSTPARVLLHFQSATGAVVSHFVEVPARARRTVQVGEVAGMGQAEFATTVEADTPILADRTMSWDRGGYGSHAETSVSAPRMLWYFAEGATHSGFELFYLLQNSSNAVTVVTVEYLLPAPAAPVVKTYTVAARSRLTIWVDQDDPRLASTDVSARITSTLPVIIERAMYFNREQIFGAGHNSAGIAAPAPRWFFAEGATGAYFDLFLLVANPSTDALEVKATYLLPSGATLTKTYTVPPQSRFNIWVDVEDQALADTAVSTVLESTNGVLFIAERAMWWPGDRPAGWFEAHNSPGTTETGTAWAVAEGEVGGAASTQTYLLVANTSPFLASVTATLLFEDGTSATRTFSIAPSSRFNVAVGAEFPEAQGRRFGAVLESVGATPAQIVVERAMYSNAGGVTWAAGTNAVASRLR